MLVMPFDLSIPNDGGSESACIVGDVVAFYRDAWGLVSGAKETTGWLQSMLVAFR